MFSFLWPVFVGPSGFLLGTLLVILLILLIAKVVFSLAWRLILVVAVVLGLLWLVGALGVGPPGLS